MRQDPTFKDIFAYGFMVEELLRWFVAGLPGGRELVEALDFSKLLRVQEQSTSGPSARKRSYANDIVWRVPFRDRPAGESESGWLHLILMIEVQGTVDHLMALRVRNYVDNHHMELWRGTRFGARDRLAPVLPIVLYNGAPAWKAEAEVSRLIAPVHEDLARYQPSQRYLLLDEGRLGMRICRSATWSRPSCAWRAVVRRRTCCVRWKCWRSG